jgi:hypothetical protein
VPAEGPGRLNPLRLRYSIKHGILLDLNKPRFYAIYLITLPAVAARASLQRPRARPATGSRTHANRQRKGYNELGLGKT